MPVISPTIGVCIITYRARDLLEGCITPLRQSPLNPRILVVNSTSNDGTVERALELGAETWVIPRGTFNHGATREAARKRLGTYLVVMMTPDGHPLTHHFLAKLLRPLAEGKADMAYARQLARAEADPIERFIRDFNYPEFGGVRSLASREQHGNYNHFCSNSCAAWRQRALDAIGGFKPTLVSEETVAACELLEAGRSIAYVPEAIVVHSHPTGLWNDFRRQFDVGYSRAQFSDLLLARGKDESRGMEFLRQLIEHLAIERPTLIPYATLHTLVRYLGYRMGMAGHRLPHRLNAWLSSQDFFWQNREIASEARGENA